MPISRQDLERVRKELSPMAITILAKFRSGMNFGPEEIYEYHKATLELIGRNFLRVGFDLLSERWIVILQPAGKRMIALLEKEN